MRGPALSELYEAWQEKRAKLKDELRPAGPDTRSQAYRCAFCGDIVNRKTRGYLINKILYVATVNKIPLEFIFHRDCARKLGDEFITRVMILEEKRP